MLKDTPTGFSCTECGREYDLDDDDLFSGGPCPSDDCPSNCPDDDVDDDVDELSCIESSDPHDIEYDR